MAATSRTLQERLAQRGVSRRDFLRFCAFTSAVLAMPAGATPRIVRALSTSATRLPLVWLEFQSCTGDTESFTRASDPTAAELLLEVLSVNFMETLMVPAGAAAEQSLADTVTQYPGQYIAVVEGSIPTRDGGIHCAVGGRTALAVAQEVCRNSLATIAVGTCAFAGGWPGAAPNPTGALGVKDAVTGIPKLINMPGCPVNVANLTALIVHYLTYNAWPSADSMGRPKFAYGEDIHDDCPRHDHYEEGRFALAWGDAGHRAGYCLYKLGCRGPRTRHNCDRVKWIDGTNWPVGAGHPCVGCAQPNFWDSMSPFYVPLPGGGDD